MEKECRKCHVTKPADEFYAHKQNRDGLSSYCKVCLKAMESERYFRLRVLKRPVPPPDGLKKCKRCAAVKPIAEFGNNKRNADGLQYNCKACDVIIQTEWRHKHPEYHRENSKKWRRKSPENNQRHYDNSVRHRIGKHVEHGTYARLLEAQGGKCAICSTTEPGRFKRFHLDHCHTTLQVRGLLCGNCNTLLGAAHDNTVYLSAAIDYLIASRKKEGE